MQKDKLDDEQLSRVNGGFKDEEDKFTWEEYFEVGITKTPYTWEKDRYTIVCGKLDDCTYEFAANITKECAQQIRTDYNRLLTKQEFLNKYKSGVIK